jgi:hypothetical protein
LFLTACGAAPIDRTAAPALKQVAPAEEAFLQFTPAQAIDAGVITFGTGYDRDTLRIPKPLTRFKRTFPVMAWSADLSRGVSAAFVTWLVVRRAPSGVEEIVFDVDEPVDGANITSLANSGDLAGLVGNVAGTYVMRYLDSREVLAEGAFTLVK